MIPSGLDKVGAKAVIAAVREHFVLNTDELTRAEAFLKSVKVTDIKKFESEHRLFVDKGQLGPQVLFYLISGGNPPNGWQKTIITDFGTASYRYEGTKASEALAKGVREFAAQWKAETGAHQPIYGADGKPISEAVISPLVQAITSNDGNLMQALSTFLVAAHYNPHDPERALMEFALINHPDLDQAARATLVDFQPPPSGDARLQAAFDSRVVYPGSVQIRRPEDPASHGRPLRAVDGSFVTQA
jgi:hypothetical protein